MSEREAFESSVSAEYRASRIPSGPSDIATSGNGVPDLPRVIHDFVASAPTSDDAAWIAALTWSVSIVDVAGFRILVTAADGTAFGFGARRGDPESTVCDIADRLQDFLVDDLRTGLPLVPGTARPATATLVGGKAMWTDTKTGWQCRIGDYSMSHRD
jgi:hypothetical protein